MTSSPEAIMLAAAIGHHVAQRKTEATQLYRQILTLDPGYPQALLGLGLLLGDAAADHATLTEAATLLERYLALHPEDAQTCCSLGLFRQREGNDVEAAKWFERSVEGAPGLMHAWLGLGVSWHQLGQLARASDALERAMELAPKDPIVANNLGDLRFTQGRFEEAVLAFDHALAIAPDYAVVHCNRGIALTRLKRFEEAAASLLKAVDLNPDNIDAQLTLAEAFDHLGQGVDAARHRREVMLRQKPMVQRSFTGKPQARILVIGGGARSDVPIKFLLPRSRFDLIHVFAVGDDERDPPLATELPEYDIVFNAIADPDNGAFYLGPAAGFCRGLSKKILNPPDRVQPLVREIMPALLADIPGLALPRTLRVSRTDLSDGKPAFALPFLIRPIGSHAGHGLEKIDHIATLTAYLEAQPADEYYLTEYFDYRSADGLFRKYRLIFVDREVYAYHLAIMDHWMIHYWRADMEAEAWMKREEAAFLADYRSVFSGVLGDAVREIARRIDLDYAGLDCGVTRDGRVLFFEANANMWVHLNDTEAAYPYKHRYVPRIFDAMAEMVARHVT
jgi:Flp pilus assembly protein TadD